MAIEPLSSAMTYQAQTTPQAKADTVSGQKPVAENTDVATEEQQANRYDATTVKVAGTEKQDSRGGGADDSAGSGVTPREQQQAINEQVKKAVEKLNQSLSHSEAIFGIHEKTNRVTIKIVDKDSKEVIKEIPPEKTLDMLAKAWELAGILVDTKG